MERHAQAHAESAGAAMSATLFERLAAIRSNIAQARAAIDQLCDVYENMELPTAERAQASNMKTPAEKPVDGWDPDKDLRIGMQTAIEGLDEAIDYLTPEPYHVDTALPQLSDTSTAH